MNEDELAASISSSLQPLGLTASKAATHRVRIPGSADKLVESARILDASGFSYLHTITATDMPKTNEFELSYWVSSLEEGRKEHVLQYVFRIPKTSPTVPSVMEVWPAAYYHEREEWEFLGIAFAGNPDMKRLWLPEDWNEMPPLLKDYKLHRWVDEERERHGLVVRGD
jgi:NADH-quinone oxidoreductase subunit C